MHTRAGAMRLSRTALNAAIDKTLTRQTKANEKEREAFGVFHRAWRRMLDNSTEANIAKWHAAEAKLDAARTRLVELAEELGLLWSVERTLTVREQYYGEPS